LNPLEINEIGELIRKRRKERNLRLEDLADENISPATISNIERGVPHVNPEKIRYLMGKLDLDLEKLPELMMDEQEQLKSIQFRLMAIETMQSIGKQEEAIDRLDALNLEDTHPYAPIGYYIRGKYFGSQGNWKRAERALFNAIRLANQSPYGKKSNIEAASYNHLGLGSYYQNNLEQALLYTNSGLEAFDPEGDRKELQFILERNKATYLEKLGRVGEAMRVVQKLWERIPEIRKIETILHLYELRTDLLRRSGMYEEAIQYAKEGLEIARMNNQHDRTFDLWTALGGVYLTIKEWDEAEICFDVALKLKGMFKNQNVFITTYTRLGILYMHQEKWNKAHEMLTEAIRLGEKLNSAFLLVDALLVMGNYYRKRGNLSEAIQFYQRALDLSREHNYKKKEYTILFHLAQCWENTDQKEFQSCMENMYKVQRELRSDEEVLELDEMV
jgi:tetratricopeptide (TPR) repeat protein